MWNDVHNKKEKEKDMSGVLELKDVGKHSWKYALNLE